MATMSAVRRRSPHITFTMNADSRANAIAKPTTGMIATQITKAIQALMARETSFQRTSACREGFSMAPSTSSSASASITPPYHMGKNPGPGPSSLMYDQPCAVTRMYSPSAASTSPDQKSPLRFTSCSDPAERAPRRCRRPRGT